MIVGLTIRNIVLIEQLDLAFESGLTVLSGETGAGKSMLLDSLALALGARSDSALIRKNCQKASVGLSIQLPENHSLRQLLDAHGIELDINENLQIRRMLNKDSHSKAFVQDTPVTVGFLKQLGQQIVDIQGQFEQSKLMNSETHRQLFDSFAKLNQQSAQVENLWQKKREANEQLQSTLKQAEISAKDAEFTKHASAELEELEPQEGEEASLEAERALLTNAEQLQQAIYSAINAIEPSDIEQVQNSNSNANIGAKNLLENAIAQLTKRSSLASDTLMPIVSSLESALSEVREAQTQLRDAATKTKGDAGQLHNLEERLFSIRAVARKHRVECDDLHRLAINMQEKLTLLDDSSTEIQRLQDIAEQTEKNYLLAAKNLSQERNAAKAPFEKKIAEILPSLKLEQAQFVLEIVEASPSANGLEKIIFKIATIQGYKPEKLNKVASAGELSRILLAISVTLADAGLADALVFDEVDSGIGGATASAVAKQLRKLAQSKQILVITHSPQVAAWGQAQFRVEKQSLDQNHLAQNGSSDDTQKSITTTKVVKLNEQARLEEIARMLAGDRITPQAREAAQSLMNAANDAFD